MITITVTDKREGSMKYTPKQLNKIISLENAIEWTDERITELKEAIVDNKLAMEDAERDANGVVFRIGDNEFDFSAGRPDTYELERAAEDIEYAWDEYESNRDDMEANKNEIVELTAKNKKAKEKLKKLKSKK